MIAQVGQNMSSGGYFVKVVDVLDECIHFMLIWNTSGLIKLNWTKCIFYIINKANSHYLIWNLDK
jgi:hypothetical protein